MRLMPLQPIEGFRKVLGACRRGFLAMIEREAGEFFGPLQTPELFLCGAAHRAWRATCRDLGGENRANARRRIRGSQPEDIDGFRRAALHFAQNPKPLPRAGAAGRAYAERQFQIDRIADKFEGLLFMPPYEVRNPLKTEPHFRPVGSKTVLLRIVFACETMRPDAGLNYLVSGNMLAAGAVDSAGAGCC